MLVFAKKVAEAYEPKVMAREDLRNRDARRDLHGREERGREQGLDEGPAIRMIGEPAYNERVSAFARALDN